MTESEYALVSRFTRIRIAITILRDASSGVPEEDALARQALLALVPLADRLQGQVQITPDPQ